MPFENQSRDRESPFASVAANRRPAGYRQTAEESDATFIGRWNEREFPPHQNVYRPLPTVPAQAADPLWNWLCQASSWVLGLAMQGFIQYAHAMYPGFSEAAQNCGCDASTDELPSARRPTGQPDACVPLAAFEAEVAAKLKAESGPKRALAFSRGRPTRAAARLLRVATRWWREAEARQQAELLRTFSDYHLRDIGLARDQIDVGTRHNAKR